MTYATREEFQNRFANRHREFRERALQQRMGEGYSAATPGEREHWLATAETIYRGLLELERVNEGLAETNFSFDHGKFLEAVFIADLLRLRTPMDGDVPRMELGDLVGEPSRGT